MGEATLGVTATGEGDGEGTKLGTAISIKIGDGDLTTVDEAYETKATDQIVKSNASVQITMGEVSSETNQCRIFANGAPVSIVGSEARPILGGTFLLQDQKSADVRLDAFGNWVVEGAVSTFKFDQIPGLVLNLSADEGYGPTRWVDWSRYRNDLLNKLTTLGPTLDGNKTIQYDGVKSLSTGDAFLVDTNDGELEVAIVARLMVPTLGGTLWSYQDADGNSVHRVQCNKVSQIFATSGNVDTAALDIDAGTWMRFHLSERASNIELFVNGASTGAPIPPGAVVPTSGRFTIGALGLGGSFGQYDVARVLVWNRKMPESFRLLVDAMLKAYYPST